LRTGWSRATVRRGSRGAKRSKVPSGRSAFGHLLPVIRHERSNLAFVPPVGLLLALAALFVIPTLGPRLAERCEIPYPGFESVGACPGGFSDTKLLTGRAGDETWEIVVTSKDQRLIAGALGRFWAQHGGNAITVFAKGARGTSGVGYDRGVLFDRNGILTFGICTAWRDFGTGIGEVCNDQLRFDVRAGPAPSSGGSPRPAPTVEETPASGEAFLTGAGDIASCTSRGDEATAAILAHVPGTIFAAGDNAYESGTAGQYQSCYDPSWGRFKDRTRPAVGNHEYLTPGAAGYFAYFGEAAGPVGKGYYSFALNGWRVFVLNSNCDAVGGCGAGSAQEQWLAAELAAFPTRCSLAIWHHPRWSSGLQGSMAEMQALWEDLYNAGTELLVVGHDHVYERFAALDAAGFPDPQRGIREFVVGTGGASHESFRTPLPPSEVRNADTFGVLRLALGADGYQWKFLAEAGATFTDAGSGTCH
jgi:hypothetical protein